MGLPAYTGYQLIAANGKSRMRWLEILNPKGVIFVEPVFTYLEAPGSKKKLKLLF